MVLNAFCKRTWHSERTGWLSVRIMRVSGIVSMSWCLWSDVPVRQHYKSWWVCTVTSWYPPTGLVSQLWSTASYLTGPQVSSSDAANVTVVSGHYCHQTRMNTRILNLGEQLRYSCKRIYKLSPPFNYFLVLFNRGQCVIYTYQQI